MKNILPLIIASAFVAGGAPALAMYPLDWQPIVSQVQARQYAMEKQIESAYAQGLIDQFELQEMKRNLDGCRVDDAYSSIESMTGGINSRSMAKLDVQQRFFENHIALKKSKVASSAHN